MTETVRRLSSALSDRYRVERELGQGGMATVYGEPVGPPTFWARGPRFSDTSGWSNRPSHDGGIVHVQGPAQNNSTCLG